MYLLWYNLLCKKVAFNMWEYFKRRNSSHYDLYTTAFSPFTYVYICNNYTKATLFRSSFTKLTHHNTMHITEHFLGICPRTLRFILLHWTSLSTGGKLLPVILPSPLCRHFAYNDISKASSPIAEVNKCRSTLCFGLVAWRRENWSWVNECWPKDWIKAL